VPQSDIELKRWKRLEYEQLVEKGVFGAGDRVELIDGVLIVAEPQSATHYTAIRLAERALVRAFGDGWHTRTQAPIALDETLERGHKASLYARAGRPEYWIVNLVGRVLEVHRDAAPSPSAPYGWHYRAMEALGAGDLLP
jgi:hypothetical protein